VAPTQPRNHRAAVPWLVGFFIGGAIALLGTASGGSENPARQLGPAIASGQTRFLWAYLLAPMLAAVLAAAARRAIHPGRRVITHRLCGPDPLLAGSRIGRLPGRSNRPHAPSWKLNAQAFDSRQERFIVTNSPATGHAAAKPIRCVVAGGSLVGLSTAIALSRLGFEVTVAERSPEQAVGGGGGLGVDVGLLREVTGIDADPPVLHGIDRDGTAWHLLQGWLEEHATRLPGVSVLRSRQVVTVTPGGPARDATVRTAQGDTFPADLVVGADGARSTVRAAMDPRHEARYAGVLLWRTLVDEQAMPANVALPRAGEPAREVYAGPYRLVTYPVPGPGGETAVGHRRLNMVWYDPEQRELLHEAGLLDGQTVHGSLAPGALPAPVRQRLADFAAARWPSPWREALTLALATGAVFGTPIVHYKPVNLVTGRVALAGDAAHAASPMVGGGFRQGLYDVLALTQAMATVGSPGEVPEALAPYSKARLAAAIRHVTRSEQATAAYLARAATRTEA
jgi:2-polyprenyl-6-methoxyphenol hydroxylase-like FAD-dependent oxidoreductase